MRRRSRIARACRRKTCTCAVPSCTGTAESCPTKSAAQLPTGLLLTMHDVGAKTHPNHSPNLIKLALCSSLTALQAVHSNVTPLNLNMNDLYDQGRKIISLFRTLTTEPKNSADGGDANAVSPIQFAKEGERFEIWAHSLGLQQRGHSSLDYRVRDAAQIRTYLREVLDELIDHLQNGEQ